MHICLYHALIDVSCLSVYLLFLYCYILEFSIHVLFIDFDLSISIYNNHLLNFIYVLNTCFENGCG